MKKVVKKFKQSLSILLAVAMVVTCVPQTAISVLAAENDAIDTVVEDTAELEVSTVDPVAVAPQSDTEEISEEGGEAPVAAAAEAAVVGDVEPNGAAGDSITLAFKSKESSDDTEGETSGKVVINDQNRTWSDDSGEESFSFEAKADENYTITTVTAKVAKEDGTSVDLVSGEDPTKNITNASGTADYKKYTVPLTTTALAIQDGGSIAFSDIQTLTITFEVEAVDDGDDDDDPAPTYTINLPNPTVAHATVELTGDGFTKEESDGTYKTVAEKDITFTVTPDSKYQLIKNNPVKYSVDNSDINNKELTTSNDTYTIASGDITGDVTINVETELKDSVVTFDVTDNDHYTIYPVVEDESNGYKKGDPLATTSNTITGKVDGSIRFMVVPDNMYTVDKVTSDNSKVRLNKSYNQDVENEKVTLYTLSGLVEAGSSVTIQASLDRRNANKVSIVTASEDIHADQQFEVTATEGAESVTNSDPESGLVIGKTFYSAENSISLTITAKTGYKITKIEKQTVVGGEPQDDLEDAQASIQGDGASATLTHTFDATQIRYVVTTEVQGLATDGGTVTFKLDSDKVPTGITLSNLTVTESDYVVAVASPEEDTKQYAIKEGATYLEFTVAPQSDKVVPAIKVGGTVWVALNSESPYSYKVPAALLTVATDIVIGETAATKNLIIWYDDEKVDESTFDLAVENDEDDNYYITLLSGRDEIKGNSAECLDIPVDSKATLTVSALEDYQIASYSINGATAVPVNKADMSVELTFDKDIEIVINSEDAEPKPEITSIKIDGVKNKELAIPVDANLGYNMKPTPSNADLSTLDYAVIWDAEGVEQADKERFNDAFNTMSASGALLITSPVLKTMEEVDALNKSLAKATIGLVDTAKSGKSEDHAYPETAIIKDSDFHIVVEEPKTLMNTTPTVSQKPVNSDVNLTLTLGIPDKDNKALPVINIGEYWYAVTVTPKDSDEKIKAADTYYILKKDGAASQDVTIRVFDDEVYAGNGWKADFDVKVKLVQSAIDAHELPDASDVSTAAPLEGENAAKLKLADSLTEFASKEGSIKQPATTKDPAYATSLKLKKGTTTLFTGQTDVKIATIDFGNSTYTSDDAVTVKDNTDGSVTKNLKVVNGDVYMSLPLDPEATEVSDYAIGKHTIRVTALAPDKTYEVYQDIVVTVNRGIEQITLVTPSNELYNNGGTKDATLKLTPTYNYNAPKGNNAPKSAKVQDYVLVAADESNHVKKVEEKDVIITDPLLTVKNGTVTVKKDYPVTEDSKFFVRATAADWKGSTVYGYSELITITTKPVEIEGHEVVLVKQAVNEDGNYIEGTYDEVVASASLDKLDTTYANYRNKAGDFGGVKVRVLKDKGKAAKNANEEDPYTDADFVDPTYLTFSSNNAKALAIDADGNVTAVSKVANKITIKVTTNDGGKQTATLEKLNILNAQPYELGLRVQELNYHYTEDGGVLYENGKELDSNYSKQTQEFTGTPNSLLKITVMRRDSEKGDWYDLDELTDLKVTLGGFQKVNTTSAFNQEYTVIANKDSATVKLAYTDLAKEKQNVTFTIKNKGVVNTAAPAGKASTTALVAGRHEGRQVITYRLTKAADIETYSNKVVWIYPDAADVAKNAKRYATFEAAADECFGYRPVEKDGSFEINFNANTEAGDRWTDPNAFTEIAAGSYKLQLVYGRVGIGGLFIPETKPVTLTLKAAAQKKGSYKPVSTVKMSVYDTAAGKKLEGTGKDYKKETEVYSELLNINFTGQKNHFTDFFVLEDGNMLKLNPDLSNPDKAGDFAALRKDLNLADTVDLVKYITEDTSKEAKNARIGYVNYSVDVSTATGMVKTTGQAKITVTFDNKKSADTYALTNPTILEGTKTATVNVLLNKKAGVANIVDAYVAGDLVLEVGENKNTITFDMRGKSGKVTLDNVYVVPANNFYAADIAAKKQAWEDLDAETESRNEETITAAKEAYISAITGHGIALKTTITIGAKASTGKKISIAKADLSRTFTNSYEEVNYGEARYTVSGYDSEWENYWVRVPYTKNMECEIADITFNDKWTVSGDSIISYSIETDELYPTGEEIDIISISINKSALADAVDHGNGKLKYSDAKKKQAYTVKATLHFGTWVSDDDPDDPEKGHLEDTGKGADGKDIIKTEDFSFKLTMPERQENDYAKAVAAVKAAKTEIESSIVLPWDWNGENAFGPDEKNQVHQYQRVKVEDEAGDTDDIDDPSDPGEPQYDDVYNELFGVLEEYINLVCDAVEEVAPLDTNVKVVMTQGPTWPEEGKDEPDENGYHGGTIALGAGDYIAPNYPTPGTFTVKVNLVDVSPVSDDSEDPKESTETPVEFVISVPTKEKAADLEADLEKFINDKKADPEALEAYFGVEKWDSDVVSGLIEDDARKALKIDDPDATTLRLCVYINDDKESFVQPTTEKDGKISGTIEINGYRYGGDPVVKEFTFTVDKLPGLGDTVTAVDTAVKALKVNNDTTADDIKKAANAAIRNKQYEAVWKIADDSDVSGEFATTVGEEAYAIKKAGRETTGSIKGKLLVKDTLSEAISDPIEVDLTIAALPSNAEIVKAVKAAVGITPGDTDDEDGVDGETVRTLVIAGKNTSGGVQQAIIDAAEAAIEAAEDKDCTIAFKLKTDAEDETDVEFAYTPAKSKVGEDGDTGKGSLYFILELKDALTDETTDIKFNKGVAYAEFGPYPELQTVDEALAALAKAAEEELTVGSAETAEEAEVLAKAAVLDKANAIVTEGGIYGLSLTVTLLEDSEELKVPTLTSVGKYVYEVHLTSSVQTSIEGSATFKVNTLQLDNIDLAVKAVQEAVAEMVITADDLGADNKETTTDTITTKANKALEGSLFEAATKTEAQYELKVKEGEDATVNDTGTATITLEVTKTGESEKADAVCELTIAALDQDAEKAKEAAEEAVAGYISTNYSGGIDEEDLAEQDGKQAETLAAIKSGIEAAVEEAVKMSVYSYTWETALAKVAAVEAPNAKEAHVGGTLKFTYDDEATGDGTFTVTVEIKINATEP